MTIVPPAIAAAFAERISLGMKETARLLGMNETTLRGHVENGNITYVSAGLGETNKRRSFTMSDVLDFLERMRRRECPSTNTPTRRTTNTTSNGVVIGFLAQREKRIEERQKSGKKPKRSA